MGGNRTGRPGSAYTNRTDLNAGPRTQPVQVATGQTYGQAGQQAAAQQAIPLPDFNALNLARPTERPAEPVTTGLPVGPGPGPEVLTPSVSTAPASGDLEAAYLQAIYDAYPSDDLADLLIESQAKGF